MDIQTQIREGERFLTGVEDGILPSSDCYNIASSLDPVLVSLIVRYLRKKYPASNPQSSGVIGRLVDLSGTYPQIVKMVQEGEQDSISEWFEETYSFRDYYNEPDKFVELIVEKLEG